MGEDLPAGTEDGWMEKGCHSKSPSLQNIRLSTTTNGGEQFIEEWIIARVESLLSKGWELHFRLAILLIISLSLLFLKPTCLTHWHILYHTHSSRLLRLSSPGLGRLPEGVIWANVQICSFLHKRGNHSHVNSPNWTQSSTVAAIISYCSDLVKSPCVRNDRTAHVVYLYLKTGALHGEWCIHLHTLTTTWSFCHLVAPMKNSPTCRPNSLTKLCASLSLHLLHHSITWDMHWMADFSPFQQMRLGRGAQIFLFSPCVPATQSPAFPVPLPQIRHYSIVKWHL